MRWRVNAHAAQDAFYHVAGWGLLLAALVTLLAFLVDRATFAAAVWTALALWGMAVFLAVRRAARRWIRRRRAAVVIDHRTELADRLATFESGRSQPSRLWALLESENVRLLPRWEPKRLAPHAVPVSLALFVVAVVAALLAFRWASFEIAARRAHPSSGEEPGSVALVESDGTNPDGASLDPSELAELLASLPDEIREALLGAPASPGEAGAEGQAVARAGAPGEVAGTSDPAKAGQGTGAGSADTPAGGTDGDGGEPRGGAGDPEPGEGRLVEGGRAKQLAPIRQGPTRTDPSPDPSEPGELSAGGAGGSGAGSGKGPGGEDGLYGGRNGLPDGGRRAFDLDLAGREIEAERQDGEGTADRAGGSLARDQRLDDAIRRAQVPPEYERIVQRLFTRDDAAQKGD